MAKLELTVATWTATVEATDDAAVIAILEAYERAYPTLNNALTPEVRLQRMLEHLVGHIEEVARSQLAKEAANAARSAVLAGDGGRW